MKPQLSMELFKLRTTPAAWITLGLTVALGAASVASNILVPVQPGGPAFGSVDHINHALSSSALTSMVMLTVGILVMAGEYRHRTILQTYLGEPRRDRVLLAKLVTVGGLGTVLGAAMFGICYLEAEVHLRGAWRPLPPGRRHPPLAGRGPRLLRLRAPRGRPRRIDPQHRRRGPRRHRLVPGHRERNPAERRS